MSAAVGVCAVAAVGLTSALTLPHFTFVLVSLFFVIPIVEATVAACARWSIRRSLALACAAIPVGYVAGGLIGWLNVPTEWETSLGMTIDATMNAAKYGSAFEHTAERVVIYFFIGGILGALVAAVGVLVAVRNRARRTAGMPHLYLSPLLSALCLLAIPMSFLNPVITVAIGAGVGLTLLPAWRAEPAFGTPESGAK
jgi:hypothetical protein